MGGYVFEGVRGRDAPRKTEYTFYIAAKDNSGNYSEVNQITVEHPRIQQLDLQDQDAKGLISSIKVKLPKVYSETSQTVYPEDTTSEEKDIIGYILYAVELNEDGTIADSSYPWSDIEDNGEIVDLDKLEEVADVEEHDTEDILNRTVTYEGDTGTTYKILVGAYDSVYHPDYNRDLYKSTISESIEVETMKIKFPDIDESLVIADDFTEELRNTDDIEDMSDKLLYRVGKTLNEGTSDEEDFAGGFGIRVDETNERVDFQLVAESFRLYPTDENNDIIADEDSAVFAVDTSTDDSTIFMNADNIAMIQGNVTLDDIQDNSYMDDDNFGGFLALNDEGLRIWTEDFRLDTDGNAKFGGEIEAIEGSFDEVTVENSMEVLGSGYINANGKTWDNNNAGFYMDYDGAGRINIGDDTQYLKFDDNDGLVIGGDAEFSGILEAAGGTFTSISGANGGVEIDAYGQFGDYGRIEINTNGGNYAYLIPSQITLHDSSGANRASLWLHTDDEGMLALEDANSNEVIKLDGRDGSAEFEGSVKAQGNEVGKWEIQKNGSDTSGVINFKT